MTSHEDCHIKYFDRIITDYRNLFNIPVIIPISSLPTPIAGRAVLIIEPTAFFPSGVPIMFFIMFIPSGDEMKSMIIFWPSGEVRNCLAIFSIPNINCKLTRQVLVHSGSDVSVFYVISC